MQIKIGKKEYYIAKPVFIVLDTLKTETGIDFAIGMNEASTRDVLNNLKILPKVIALITLDEPDEEYDEEKISEREKYFYKNAQLVDFLKALGFFSELLKGKEPDSEGQSKPEKAHKGNLKLVKTK